MPKKKVVESLWGEDFNIGIEDNTSIVLSKLSGAKDVKRAMKSDKIPLEDKMAYIESEVNRILGKYKEDTVVITSKEDYDDYINTAIKNGIIAIDTETNNTINSFNCLLMGLCLYTPGSKSAYVPVNHVDGNGDKLKNQLKENDIYIGLKKILDSKTFEIYHNAVFDIEVLNTTCGIRMKADWDTMVGAQMVDENEPKSLKTQYRIHIDPSQEKYDIEHLFQGLSYAIFSPELFALYAATDSKMTYEMYLYQKNELEKPDNASVLELFKTIEMPVLDVVVDMETTGICVDTEYAKRMSAVYHAKSEEIEKEIGDELLLLKPQIDAWRLTKEATFKPPAKNKTGVGKSKNEQLTLNIDLGSSTQLAILLYDILKVPVVNKDRPRTTDSDALETLAEDYHINICKLLLKKRAVDILINTFIDAIPEFINKDGRVHTRFNSTGTACITSDSLLLTDDGYVPIGSLFDGTENNGEFYGCDKLIYNKNIELEKAEYKIAYYNVPTRRIRVQGGYTIEGTMNHPIMCSKVNCGDLKRNDSKKNRKLMEDSCDFRQLSDINVGDIIPIPYGYNKFPSTYQRLNCDLLDRKTTGSESVVMPEYCNEDFAEFLGMYFADGTIKEGNGSFQIRITNSDNDVADRVKYLAKTLFNANVRVVPNEKHNTQDIIFGSIRLSNLKMYLPKLARNKCVPDIIMRSPKSVVCSFIRGLTLDSSYSKSRHRLKITIANPTTQSFVKNALLNMGIITSSSLTVYDSLKDHAGNPVDKLVVDRILISGEMYDKFIEEINPIQSSKVDRVPFGRKSRWKEHNGYFYLNVVSVDDGYRNVYDLNIPCTHSFIANGIINHNTGRFSCSSPNMQQLPSEEKTIRMMFMATVDEHNVEELNDCYTVPYTDSVEVSPNNWVRVSDIKIGDKVLTSDGNYDIISNVEMNGDNYILHVEGRCVNE